MTLAEYEDFVYSAVHADKEDPIAIWRKVEIEQQHIVDLFNKGDKVELRGPNVDLTLSVKGRTFMNAAGSHNMPDGEIFTGPVEDSVNGWVRFTYPAIYQGRAVEDAELKFENGYITQATSRTNQDFMLKMLDSDKGARYLGEFAIGTNFGISRFTGEILFDEKINGSFHMAMGASLPESGGKNESAIHWDIVKDMRREGQVYLDDRLIFEKGHMLI